MPTVQVPAQLSVEHLMDAVRKLSPEELREFSRQFDRWQKKNGDGEAEEAKLIKATRERLPATDERRLKRLMAKTDLNEKEHEECLALIRKAEEVTVRRVEALAKLVKLRGKPARTVMKEIGWKSGGYER
jgi:hypothetical protein